jgi:thiamine-monophosphate kinase
MGEHDRIARFFAPLTMAEPGAFNLTDDAAALDVPHGKRLVITTDSVIEGIHVLPGATPAQIAQKLMRRNLSDLAAMGATPWRYSLNLHTPHGLADDWFAAFADMLHAEQERFGLVLIGGDSTSGGDAVHATLTCYGLSDGPLLTRAGARAGDDLYVSGTIGDAALALEWLQHGQDAPEALSARYHAPEPRLALGRALRGMATAALDISDGLVADAVQLCRTSNLSATILRDAIPLSDDARAMLHNQPELWQQVVAGGDDYELCFSAPANQRDALDALATTLALPLTRIGTLQVGSGVTLVDANGVPIALANVGWSH